MQARACGLARAEQRQVLIPHGVERHQMGGSLLGPSGIDCHVHRRVVAGLTGGDADDLRGEPALIPLVHP